MCLHVDTEEVHHSDHHSLTGPIKTIVCHPDHDIEGTTVSLQPFHLHCNPNYDFSSTLMARKKCPKDMGDGLPKQRPNSKMQLSCGH